MDLSSNAGDVAAAIDAAVTDLEDLEGANAAAARLGLEAVNAETPVRTGTLLAGARAVADPFGFAYVNATPYAATVDARIGFASDTLKVHEAALVDVYEKHVETALAPLE